MKRVSHCMHYSDGDIRQDRGTAHHFKFQQAVEVAVIALGLHRLGLHLLCNSTSALPPRHPSLGPCRSPW